MLRWPLWRQQVQRPNRDWTDVVPNSSDHNYLSRTWCSDVLSSIYITWLWAFKSCNPEGSCTVGHWLTRGSFEMSCLCCVDCWILSFKLGYPEHPCSIRKLSHIHLNMCLLYLCVCVRVSVCVCCAPASLGIVKLVHWLDVHSRKSCN